MTLRELSAYTFLKKYPNTEGAVNCLALKNKILVKSFDFVVEKNQSPDKAILARLNYKNIDSLYFRIVRIDWLTDRKKTRNIYDSTLVSYYIKKIPVKTFSVGVPDSADYQDYSTEFAMPSMPIGQYFVIASNRKDFKWDKNEYGYAYFNVTNLSYLSRRFNNEKMDFIILNRQTGAPEQNVNAQLWKEDYSYILQAYDYYKSSSFITDANGKFSVPAPKDYRYFFVELTKGNDALLSIAAANAVSSIYSADYLKKMARAATLAETVTVQFAKDYPLKLDFRSLNKLQMAFVLAPRIENK